MLKASASCAESPISSARRCLTPFRFTFSAAVSGFSTSGITVSNGFTSSSVSKLSDTVYTVQVTPNNGIDGVVGLQVLAGAFKDASGTINVEIDDEHWPAQAISETATVKITGEVDRDLMSREIDVEYLELVN